MYVSPLREPLITGNKDYTKITEDISRPIVNKPGKTWFLGITLPSTALMIGVFASVINL